MVENLESETKEQVKFIGKRAETKILAGEAVFLNEVERTWVKSLVEKRGVDLSEMKDNRNLGNQARGVANRMGEAEAIGFTAKVITKMLEIKGGGVWGKDNPVTEDRKKEVKQFVVEYLGKRFAGGEIKFDPEKYKGDGTPGSNWKMNTICRIEAVLSATNKLMYVLSGEGEEEGTERQKSEVVDKYLRQRVIRGDERFRGEMRQEKPIIRHLPKGGLSVILEHLVAA